MTYKSYFIFLRFTYLFEVELHIQKGRQRKGDLPAIDSLPNGQRPDPSQVRAGALSESPMWTDRRALSLTFSNCLAHIYIFSIYG